MCTSPELFAAYHVLRRLLVPRHPPCALCSLIFVLGMISHPPNSNEIESFLRFFDLSILNENWFSIFTRCHCFLLESFDLMFVCNFQGASIPFCKNSRQPPAFPYRLQYSIIGRPGLNHRVRDGNGCDPRTYRRREKSVRS